VDEGLRQRSAGNFFCEDYFSYYHYSEVVVLAEQQQEEETEEGRGGGGGGGGRRRGTMRSYLCLHGLCQTIGEVPLSRE